MNSSFPKKLCIVNRLLRWMLKHKLFMVTAAAHVESSEFGHSNTIEESFVCFHQSVVICNSLIILKRS